MDQPRSPGQVILGQIVRWTARVLSLLLILAVGFEMAEGFQRGRESVQRDSPIRSALSGRDSRLNPRLMAAGTLVYLRTGCLPNARADIQQPRHPAVEYFLTEIGRQSRTYG